MAGSVTPRTATAPDTNNTHSLVVYTSLHVMSCHVMSRDGRRCIIKDPANQAGCPDTFLVAAGDMARGK